MSLFVNVSSVEQCLCGVDQCLSTVSLLFSSLSLLGCLLLCGRFYSFCSLSLLSGGGKFHKKRLKSFLSNEELLGFVLGQTIRRVSGTTSSVSSSKRSLPLGAVRLVSYSCP